MNFTLFYSYIYKNEININSVSNGLALLMVSNQFMLNGLSRSALTFLHQNVSAFNVLEILSILRCPQNFVSRCLYVNEEPSILQNSQDENNGNQINSNCDNILNELITKCYSILDGHAEKILLSESIDILDHVMLIEILSRDTLRVSSELVIFECLSRWSSQQCKKQRKELITENKRDLLGKALYCARYLVMSRQEFMQSPYVCDLLSDHEKGLFLARLSGDNSTPLPAHLIGKKLDVKRNFAKPTGMVSPNRRAHVHSASPTQSTLAPTDSSPPPIDPQLPDSSHSLPVVRKKNSTSKKLLNGLGDFMICVIQMLD